MKVRISPSSGKNLNLKRSYEESWDRDLLITKEKRKLICSGNGYRQKDHETPMGGDSYENSVADDLELFYDNIQLGRKPVSLAWTYFSPELTPKEMELVEKRDQEYMRSFKMLNNADVNKTEMNLSASSSKYVIAYCRRRTIAIDSQNFSDENQESNSAKRKSRVKFSHPNFTSSIDLHVINSEIELSSELINHNRIHPEIDYELYPELYENFDHESLDELL